MNNLKKASPYQEGERIRYCLQGVGEGETGTAEIETIYSDTYATKGYPFTIYPEEVLGRAHPSSRFAPPPEHRADVRPGPRTL